jgi:hypothetical protein
LPKQTLEQQHAMRRRWDARRAEPEDSPDLTHEEEIEIMELATCNLNKCGNAVLKKARGE